MAADHDHRYRVPIGKFLETISSRATEIGIGWASIKLPEVKEASPAPVNVIRKLKSDLWQESSSQWFPEFSSSTASSEYALLNLGDGQEWISSRLFIFAVMLQRMKSLKCVVFTSALASGDRRFLGCASPENIRWAIAADQPWLEAAYAQAYSKLFLLNPAASFTRIDGSMKPTVAETVVREFILSLKDPTGTLALSDPDNALIYAAVENRNATYRSLNAALEVHDVHPALLPADPKWDAFRAEPEFIDLIKRCGLAY